MRAWARNSTILPSTIAEHGVVLHDQEAVVVLLQDGHELKGGKGAPDFQLRDVEVQASEGATVVAQMKRILWRCKLWWLFRALVSRSTVASKTLKVSEQGDGQVEFDFHDRIWMALGIWERGKGAGLK